ncbi:hypothetical protein JKF63_05732 [Porcisia hertigi]|uniref:t-SNARE coiled-coil homology domain-containing protein n=1 Tax=Porcisia hertigi TaxID=2761500 RepID=A0A836I943_9TRYP|nr:hypothetical protein JKF63_05732 [Porcisia hertigi]
MHTQSSDQREAFNREMSLENGETLSRCIQQLIKACGDVKVSIKELGTGRDAIARDRLRHTRLLVQRCNSRVEVIPHNADLSLESLKHQYTQRKAEFEVLNAEATRREQQTFRQTDPADMREEHLDGLESQVTFREVRSVDMSGFHTEEAIQREKLQSARDIESDVMDLKTTIQEFYSLVRQQQEGLDHVSNNVTESHSLIERGHDQIQSASGQQQSWRKIGCLGSVLLLLVVTLVIVVVSFAL